jgi:hypothetical protein
VLGSPSQALNVQQLLTRSRQRAKQQIQSHNYLGALQTLAVAAGAELKHQSVVDLSRYMSTLAWCDVHGTLYNLIRQMIADP